MPIPKTYNQSFTWNAANRPSTSVDFLTSGGALAFSVDMLVDTGADHLAIDASFASSLGLTVSTMARDPVTLANGTVAHEPYEYVRVAFLGKRLRNVKCYFSGTGVALLGRVPLLTARETAFDPTGWHCD